MPVAVNAVTPSTASVPPARCCVRPVLPRVPSGLLDRLRELPITAELPTVQFPSGLSADGQPVFAAFASRDSAGQLGSVGVGSAAFGSAALGSVAFRTAPVAPVWSGPPATPPRLATSPDGAARQRSQAVPSHLSSPDHQASLDHPASTVHLRRRMSSRAGFGAAAVAAVAVGMLASHRCCRRWGSHDHEPTSCSRCSFLEWLRRVAVVRPDRDRAAHLHSQPQVADFGVDCIGGRRTSPGSQPLRTGPPRPTPGSSIRRSPSTPAKGVEE